MGQSLIFSLLFFMNLSSYAYDVKLEEQKINFLIKQIESSSAIFERNGEKHSAKKAVSHIKFKMVRAKGFFSFFSSPKITAKNFIEKIASKSSTTGKPYFIILKNGTRYKMEDWLNKEIKKFNVPKSDP